MQAFLETQDDITVVAEAESGEAAVREAVEHAPDVALMDLIMPGTTPGGKGGPARVDDSIRLCLRILWWFV